MSSTAMAKAIMSRVLLSSKHPSSLRSCVRKPNFFSLATFFPSLMNPKTHISSSFFLPTTTHRFTLLSSPFSSSSQPPDHTQRINTKVNFSLSDSDSEEEEEVSKKQELDKSKLPPPYDPFNKKPVIEEPQDPKNLQQVFHNMRSDGLISNAVKMFDALSKDGLTHEALELFSQFKDKGQMPDVVAHTAVIEAYANAGHCKEALKGFMRMLASGVAPNAYTYTVLIKGLAAGDAKHLGDAKKYLMEMLEKGIRPNAGTYMAVFEAFARVEKVDEAKDFLERMEEKGFVPDEKDVREVLRNKRGPGFRSVMSILFDK
ncbi:pentatricopeptide repeat-containing protein At4g38150-like [Herrania umbratica]|uniref:Pentatricopeptide repeat-containing protein At4g38150-like n=1 Tax=Herrania umbratica TaxID=108875 RepID=A0A6J1BP82_9ROSI|nr:pentatricopeptide repeat-containing protein At4g38150-like [Herrania umbratica]